MLQTNELRLFISSTFRDMQEEREHLVKKVFPEIRAICRERGITFTEVDLRWALTEENAILGQVIRTCLEEIDKCRPYFIGMLGSRYGWVPEFHEIMMDPDLLATYPWIEEVAMDGTSVTEMEFIHGVFGSPETSDGSTEGRDTEYACFYHRNKSVDEIDNPERLAALVERTRASDHPFHSFESPEELGELVRNDLLSLIESTWPEINTPSALELERRAHQAFAFSRTRAYIPDPRYLKEFTLWMKEGNSPLVIQGDSGLGKSSLVAYLANYYRTKHPGAVVIQYHIGALDSSGSASSVMSHIIEELRERFSIDEELPASQSALEKGFSNWLYRAEHLAREEELPVLIVIDALNQLSEQEQHLSWLPERWPSGISLMLSTTPEGAGTVLGERGWQSCLVTPLEDQRIRQSIVVRYVREFRKGIAPEQLERITSDPQGSSPLYLRVVAEELRLHGEHETIGDVIDRYTGLKDLTAVFQEMLKRIEQDHGEQVVKPVLESLFVSRSGLSETELLQLTGIPRIQLSRLLLSFDYHLLQKNGLLDFFHDYLRRGVEERYFETDGYRERVHARLAAFFEGEELTERSARELLWHYASSGNDEKLAATITRLDIFSLLYRDEIRFDLLAYWSRLMGRGENPEDHYRASLDRMAASSAPDKNRAELLHSIASLLESLGKWDTAKEMYTELIAWGKEQESPLQTINGLLGLGDILLNRGNYGQAIETLEEALVLSTTEANSSATGRAHGAMGNLHARQSRYNEALEHYRKHLEISTELGDKSGMSRATGNIGHIHFASGRYGEALEHHVYAHTINKQLGNRQGIALALGNIGLVYDAQGDFAEGLISFEEELVIWEELGDRSGQSRALGNIGSIYNKQGRYEEALECQRKRLAICEELGDQREASYALANIGDVLSNKGQHSEALHFYTRYHDICIELNDRRGLSYALGNIGTVCFREGQYEEALKYFHRQVELCEELGILRGIARGMNSTGLLHQTTGNFTEALGCYERQQSICRDIGDRLGMAYATGSAGMVHQLQGNLEKAMACFVEAVDNHREIGFFYGVTIWREWQARLLLELATDNSASPSLLHVWLPELAETHSLDDNGRKVLLSLAREHAQECLEHSEKLRMSSSVREGNILLARIDAAEGKKDQAVQRLATLLEEATNDVEKAPLHYWLWRIHEEMPEGHRAESLRFYQNLYKGNPNFEYKKRIEELQKNERETPLRWRSETEAPGLDGGINDE